METRTLETFNLALPAINLGGPEYTEAEKIVYHKILNRKWWGDFYDENMIKTKVLECDVLALVNKLHKANVIEHIVSDASKRDKKSKSDKLKKIHYKK